MVAAVLVIPSNTSTWPEPLQQNQEAMQREHTLHPPQNIILSYSCSRVHIPASSHLRALRLHVPPSTFCRKGTYQAGVSIVIAHVRRTIAQHSFYTLFR